MSRFRPCIDLHQGEVKQIVGGTLKDDSSGPQENFVSSRPSTWFATRYREDRLTGGHVIKLGPGNDQAAKEALAAYPSGLQIGGGITPDNAMEWIDAGASHVIVTSWIFDSNGKLSEEKLKQLVKVVGKNRIVIDLSCRRVDSLDQEPAWRVAMNRWQTITELPITTASLDRLAEFADEFLIHAADVEGLCQGIDADLASRIGGWGKLPITYAGGVASMDDLNLIRDASSGRLDVTVGSALDLFGGNQISYTDLLRWNRASEA